MFVDYDDDNVGAEGYYDNIDEDRIDEAIGSHDPAIEYQNQTQICTLIIKPFNLF